LYIKGKGYPIADQQNKRNFLKDPTLPPDFAAITNPYGAEVDGVSYDGGHLTPVAHRNRYNKDIVAVNLISNIIPQQSSNNQREWLAIETFAKKMVMKGNKEVYITAGTDGIKQLKDGSGDAKVIARGGNITIPENIWVTMLVIDPDKEPTNNSYTIGFYLENREYSRPSDKAAGIPSTPNEWQSTVKSVNWIENKIGYDLFSNIDTTFQDEIEDNTVLFSNGIIPTGWSPKLSTPLMGEKFIGTDTYQQPLENIYSLFTNLAITNDTTIWHSGGGVYNSSADVGISNTSQISISDVSAFERSSGQISVGEISANQIGHIQTHIIETGSTQVGSSQNGGEQFGISKISTNQVGIIKDTLGQIGTAQVGITQIGTFKDNTHHHTLTQISPTEVSIGKINITQIGFTQVSTTEINANQFAATQINVPKVSLSSSIPFQQFFDFHNLPLALNNTYKDNPLNLWNTLFDLTNPFDLSFQIADLPTGQLAEAQITQFDTYGRPNGGTLLIDHDANGVGWFIDTTPWENTEFTQTLTDTSFRATTGEAVGKYDLLTTILHEMGHLAGIIAGNPGFDKHVQTINGAKTFVGDNFTATLTNDGSHLDSKVQPYDLMNNTLAPGVRKLPSWLNLQMVNAIRNTTIAPSSITQLKAPLSAILLAEITNGNFNETNTTKPEFGWSTRGAATILNQEAVLTEDSPFNSNFSQSFIIPEGAKYLQFTLKNTTLGGNTPTSPGDAFEVALLNANTKQSLINTVTGLTQTDSLLNIQNDGTAYTNNKVKLINTTPNNKLTLNQPLTFKVDLTGIQAGTAATLYFDLLGFGARDAKVVLDNVMLLNNDFIAPVANNDAATTNQTKPVTINVLANDTDADNTINPIPKIETNPTNGTTLINQDGTVTYTPNATFVGTDTFTYTVVDSDGLTSNTATVNITVNNIAPIITVITGDTTTTEGTSASFNATATDPGDTLTYLWNFGDNSQLVEGQNTTHTYKDNGSYIATLTVTDSKGINSFQTLQITVNNLAPTVNAGADQTINEGQTVIFNGQFTDPGILDTHTTTWDFGDGTTVTGILNPTHIYTSDGTYTATLTVTDNAGASTTDTLTVTVNNLAPTITQLTGTTEVAEGSPANFSASAVDLGNDTLTYTWNFGDGSNPVQGKDATHTFLDNGIYAVTLTVTDNSGASTTQTLSTKVNNVAATVNAGTDQTMYQNEPVIFDGQFTDPGILDTHTIEWNFGDGNTVTGVLNPNHIYTQNGEYTVTLTITDKDGAVSNDTMTVTVKKPPTMSVSDISIVEGDNGNKYAVFTANLSEASLRTITANYSTTDGTATEGSDYTATNGTISFASGEISKTITVQLIGDTLDEFDETFFLNILDATNATIVSNKATATILDDDTAPTLTIGDKTITEGDNGTATITYTVNLSAASAKPISVKYATADATAIAGTDYTATNGIVSFAPGETSKTITIQVLGDTLDEFDETFFLNILDAENATIIKNQALTTILDNDAPPLITISDRTITEGDNGTAIVTYTINLSATSGKAITVDYNTQDGTATAGKDYIATNGKITFAPGETSKTITVQVLGDTIDEFDETFFLNLTNPENATTTKNQAVTTILDNDAPPIMIIGDKTITEGHNGTAIITYTVNLSAASAKPISVKYATADGTATAGTDYTATNGIVTFAPGETSKTVTVQVLGDTIDEFDEIFFLNLTNPENATITKNQAVSTILDNDVPPALTIGDKTITEGDNGSQLVTYTINLNTASGKPVSVNYTTADGSAIAGTDYTATNGTITFTPGETSKTITVQVLGDTIDEFDETFFLNLTNPENATTTKNQAVTTILDNDAPPIMIIGDRTITEGHNGTQILNFTVSLNTASEKAISVKYSTANGTATAGSDYTATNGILNFAAGETTKTIAVQIIGDRNYEQNENFFVNLSEAINANIADAQAVATILDDDESPTLTVQAVPGELWPPNHKMVEVKVNKQVSDDFDANPIVKLVSITSNEPDNGLGDGDTAGDIEIRSDGRIFLRAERSGGGNGRVYTLTYSATDSAGNITYSTTQVKVPKSKGQ
jgi:DNA/RNA endonuclease G (NUC1)/PKD repeat protein